MKLNIFTLSVLLFMISGLFSCQKISDPNNEFVNVKAFYNDWLSRRAMELKQKESAHEFALKALENQESSGLESNLGITFDLVEKKSDAEKSLLSALSHAVTDEEKFKYKYNLGVLLGSQKKIPEALEHYQAALDILPSSIETKHNIELLIQQQQQDQKDGKDKKEGDKGKGKDDKENEKKDDKDGKSKDDPKDDKDKDGKDKKEKEDKGKDRQSTAKYKPRPYKGDQLTEGDVKKILGELSQQDQKIRSQFNKKEQRKEDKNEKDW